MNSLLSTLILLVIGLNCFSQNNIELEFKHDSVDGHRKLCFPNGKTNVEYDVVNGKVNGRMTIYNKNGKVYKTIDITDNKYNGEVKIFDNKGRVGFYQLTRNDTLLLEVDSGYYFFGKHLRGRWFWSRESDINMDKISVKNKDAFNKFWNYYGYVPAINGTTTIYYMSGQKKKEKPRTDGKRNGKWKWFDKHGTQTKSVTYDMGKRVK